MVDGGMAMMSNYATSHVLHTHGSFNVESTRTFVNINSGFATLE